MKAPVTLTRMQINELPRQMNELKQEVNAEFKRLRRQVEYLENLIGENK